MMEVFALALSLALGQGLPHQCTPLESSLFGSAPLIVESLAKNWQQEFSRQSFISVQLNGPAGPPQGSLSPSFQRFLTGKSDFAFLSREISEADLATFRKSHGAEPLVVPVAGGAWDRFGFVDAVAIVVNSENPVPRLSFSQLDAIFSMTHLRAPAAATWRDVGVREWGDRPIHVVGGGAWSEAESARALTIRRRVLSVGGRAGAWRLAPGSGNEAEVVQRVLKDPLAIGFTGLGHLQHGVRAIAISESVRGVASLPTLATIRAGIYPLARTIDLVIPASVDVCHRKALLTFAHYLISAPGQRVVQGSGMFLPLDPLQLRHARALLKASSAPR